MAPRSVLSLHSRPLAKLLAPPLQHTEPTLGSPVPAWGIAGPSSLSLYPEVPSPSTARRIFWRLMSAIRCFSPSLEQTPDS